MRHVAETLNIDLEELYVYIGALSFLWFPILARLRKTLLCLRSVDYVELQLQVSSGTIMAYVGIKLSSPTLASALINLLPAFTFILALIFRVEEASVAKKYPAITMIVFFQLLSSTMQCGVFALIVICTSSFSLHPWRTKPSSTIFLYFVLCSNLWQSFSPLSRVQSFLEMISVLEDLFLADILTSMAMWSNIEAT
ncbi:hypothetical protein V8G54_003736 [Vigna mungo]|uniref:WAT1-related protein n=1 Tax=Vigna mungo TaxID=3915 RepID=A0AAQ3PE00_VIGMU